MNETENPDLPNAEISTISPEARSAVNKCPCKAWICGKSMV
ncbi:hypothetical protein HMPREF0043_01144 [Actinobaculum sp. oral taxon 183 str. F0552]|nr:hypothetical protein HMPREF0043_01144 [Actinobaculum sp. oral taxon 183 str. F0552]